MNDLLHQSRLIEQMNERKTWRERREKKLKSRPRVVSIYGVRYFREDVVLDRRVKVATAKVDEVIR